jgi:hypothetical protein
VLQLKQNILESKIQTQYQQEKNILLTNKVAELTNALKEANINLAMKEEDLASSTNCLTVGVNNTNKTLVCIIC